MRITRSLPRPARAAIVAALLAAPPLSAPRAAVCSNPGVDSTATVSGIVNSYYPGVSAPAGSTTITVGTIDTTGGGSSTPIAPGNLILVMQMQDADLNTTNTSSYGGSAPGTGYTALNGAGVYEYAVVSSVSGATIGLTAPLQNGYRNAGYVAGVSGQRRFQVLRVPQFSSVQFPGGTVYVAPPWNGRTGGVVAFDVAGNLNWGGSTIEVSGRGFRGGAGRSLAGAGAGTTLLNTDYVSSASTAAHAGKGEGIAGTPRYVFTPNPASQANYATNGAGSATDTGVEGYPGGSFARGAPGNAGGGGSDGNPAANDQNTGGGGGGSFSVGGMGGYGWTPNTPPGSKTGGFGGYSVPMAPGLLTLGGGGGAGSMNNGTGTPAGGLATSGGAGGGVVVIRARTVTGTGTINANGAHANSTVLNDASGGGGGGGAVLVFASNDGGSLGTLTVNARGGNGGSNTPGTGVNPHGPGGGGSGGFVAITSAAGVTVNVQPGVNGTTNASATTTADYGATGSAGGYRVYSIQPVDLPGASSNALCLPLLTVTKSAVKNDAMRSGTASYVLTVENAAGYGTATGVRLQDTLPGSPSPFTVLSTDSITLTGGATRTSGTDPAVGATSPSWGSFSVPGGGAVSVRFTAAIPAGTALGTYQNGATVVYTDPTATSGGQTVTPGGTYAGGGAVPGTNYAASSSALDDVTVRDPAALSKSFTPAGMAPGQTSRLAIVITNPTPVALGATALTDAYPVGVTNTATPAAQLDGPGCLGAITAPANGGAISLASGTIPAGGTCTLSVNVTTAAAGSYTNTIPAGALANDRNVSNPTPATATLNQSAIQAPAVTTAFLPAVIQQGATTTLSLTVTNGGTTGLTGIAFTDTLTSVQVAPAPAVTNGCGGTVTATAGASTVTLAGGALAAGATCTITVQVTSATPSPAAGYPTTATGITSTQSGAGAASNTAWLVVAATPTIAQAFAPASIAPGAQSVLTFTLTNSGNVPLTGATFSDAMGYLTVPATAAAGGTCAGAAGNTLAAGSTNIVLSGLTLPAASSCTVTVPVTTTVSGPQVNVANGVASAETPTPGPQSAPATLNVLFPPSVATSFAGMVEAAVATSYATLSIAVANPNVADALSNVSFTDALTNMVVHATPAATNGCGGTLTASAGGSTVSLAGGTLAAGASCTVTVRVRSSTPSPAGGHPNTVAATAAETGTSAGPSDTAYLNVLAPPTISVAFSPSAIDVTTGVSVMTLTLTNPNAVGLTGGTFTDALPAGLSTTAAVQSYVGAGRGTCTGPIPSGQTASTATLSFSGVNIPANGSCTILVDVRGTATGLYSNTASGLTTFQTPTAGPASNAATLSVGRMGIAKSFSPATIVAGGASTLTFVLENPTGRDATSVTFRDAFPANLSVAAPLSVTSSCGGTLRNHGDTANLAAGATGLRLVNGAVASNATCTLTVRVTASAAGAYDNQTTGLAYQTNQPGTGSDSNVATLTVVDHPTLALAFSPATLDLYATSTMTFTLTNPNPTALTGAAFTQALSGITVASPAILGGTCAGVTSTPALAAGATSLALTVPNLLPGSCTVTVPVTRLASTPGAFANAASGVTTVETATAGPASNTATITFNRLPLQVMKSAGLATATPGTAVTYTISYSNPNATTGFGSVVITDAIPAYTRFSSASCGPLPPSITSCTVSAPPVGSVGTVTWTLGGTLAAGASGTVSLTVVVN